MKVIKVIVDELPENCTVCQFSNWRQKGRLLECDCMNKLIDHDIGWSTRPDWCPLVELDYDKLIEIWRDDAIKDR
jgi:hypothetical protein